MPVAKSMANSSVSSQIVSTENKEEIDGVIKMITFYSAVNAMVTLVGSEWYIGKVSDTCRTL